MADGIIAAFKNVIPVRLQHPVADYIVDIYFPSIGLVIEIDEFDHESYNSIKEGYREEIISETLKCELIRFNPNLPGNNICTLINIILKHFVDKEKSILNV